MSLAGALKKLSQLTGQLARIKKSANYPVRPPNSPSALYLADKIKEHRLPPPGVGSTRNLLIKSIYRDINQEWATLNPSIKQHYVDKSQTLVERYNQQKSDWEILYRGTTQERQIMEIGDEIKRLKSLINKVKDDISSGETLR